MVWCLSFDEKIFNAEKDRVSINIKSAKLMIRIEPGKRMVRRREDPPMETSITLEEVKGVFVVGEESSLRIPLRTRNETRAAVVRTMRVSEKSKILPKRLENVAFVEVEEVVVELRDDISG